MNNTQTKRDDDDIVEDDNEIEIDDDFKEVTVNEDDIAENKDIDRIVDETERQQWDEDDSTLPDAEVGQTLTGMADVDNPNRRDYMGQRIGQGAPDDGSIVNDEQVEDIEDLDGEDDEDEDDMVDVPM